MQKVKHLEYEHGNNCDKVKIDAQKIMKEERVHHIENDKDMLAKKKEQKQQYIGDDSTNQGDIEHREKDLDANYKDTEDMLNDQRKELIGKYEIKMTELRQELELRMKVEIHEIEERKNQHINELMMNHQEAFTEMKVYYNDITRENLELIRMHKDKLIDIRK
jgi:growth arrest-specific protein 8